jgi:hypothetical protein
MRFSPTAAIQYCWDTFKKRPWFFVGAVAILLAANFLNIGVTSGVNSLTGGTLEEPTIVSNVVNLALSALIVIGAVAFSWLPTTIPMAWRMRRCGIRPRIGNSSRPRF